MSVIRYDRDGLSVATYAGPAGCNERAGGRTMVQITSRGSYLGLTMDHWIDLVCLVRRMDEAGIGITELPEIG